MHEKLKKNRKKKKINTRWFEEKNRENNRVKFVIDSSLERDDDTIDMSFFKNIIQFIKHSSRINYKGKKKNRKTWKEEQKEKEHVDVSIGR